MKKEKVPNSINIIYWITNIGFWLYIAAVLFLFIVISIHLVNNNPNINLQVGVPVSIDMEEEGIANLPFTDNITKLKFTNLSGGIHFIDNPPIVNNIYAGFTLITAILYFFIFLTIKRFIYNIYNGKYFDYNNIILLKKISYFLVGIWLFNVFYSYFQYYFIIRNLEFPTIKTTYDIHIEPKLLLIALTIWVLSHIFGKGCKLQEDSQLTI